MTALLNPVLSRLTADPDRIAAEDGVAALSGGDLARLAGEAAGALGAAGVTPAEPVLLAVSNRAADLAGFLGVWMAGAVAVPVHRRASPATLARIRALTGARLGVDLCPELESVVPPGPLAEAPPAPRPLLEGAATVIFTSGSTGEPKGVVIGRDRFAAKLAALREVLRPVAGERCLLPLQLTFIFGQWVALLTLMTGGRVLLRDRVAAGALAAELAGGGIARCAAVPTMLRALAPLMAASPYAGAVLSGGEVMPPGLAARIARDWPGARLWDLYGLSETGSCDFAVAPGDYPQAAGSIGRPMPGVAFRIDPESGELMIRSPFGMLGYLDRPELTGAAFDGDWFRTGDRAEERSDGRVALTGRLTDLINRGGNKIAPVEIERAAEAHPVIEAALAAGVTAPGGGEAIHLFVVSPGLGEGELRDWLAGRLEPFKLPDRIHFGDALPTGATGKADREALRALARIP